MSEEALEELPDAPLYLHNFGVSIASLRHNWGWGEASKSALTLALWEESRHPPCWRWPSRPINPGLGT